MNIKYNKKIIFTILFFISILSILFIYFQSKNNNQIIIPTPMPTKFELLKTIPNNNTESSILPTQSLEFQFSKPIDISSILLTITPYDGFTFEKTNGNKTLLIRPTPIWKVKTDYQLKFNIESEDGEKIPEIIYYFKIIPMTDSPLID